MITQEVKLKKLKENAVIPSYGSAYSAGADLYACLDTACTIEPGKTVFVPTGIALEIPVGFAGFIYARSGMASKRGAAPANKVGVIDADYRGEIIVALHNHNNTATVVEPGERIAQLVIAPFLKAIFCETDTLSETQRGSGGFGSTGSK